QEGRGVLLYLRQEGRGIGLLNKIRAYHLQDGGADTVEANERLGFAADQREYSICLPMLDHLGIHSLKLMTNNPRKVHALASWAICSATCTRTSRKPDGSPGLAAPPEPALVVAAAGRGAALAGAGQCPGSGATAAHAAVYRRAVWTGADPEGVPGLQARPV